MARPSKHVAELERKIAEARANADMLRSRRDTAIADADKQIAEQYGRIDGYQIALNLLKSKKPRD